MTRRNYLLGGLTIAAVVLVPGLSKFALTSMGYGDLGTLVFYGGYFLGAVAIWYLWIRPLQLRGPVDGDTPDEVEPRESDS